MRAISGLVMKASTQFSHNDLARQISPVNLLRLTHHLSAIGRHKNVRQPTRVQLPFCLSAGVGVLVSDESSDF